MNTQCSKMTQSQCYLKPKTEPITAEALLHSGKLWMSGAIRSLPRSLKVNNACFHFFLLNSQTLIHFPQPLLKKARVFHQLIRVTSFHSSSSFQNALEFDILSQILPSNVSSSNAVNTTINSHDRHKLTLAISKIVQQGKGRVFRDFSSNFCPFSLVEIMKSLGDRHLAFPFFKYVFRDHSDGVIRRCYVAVHLLISEGQRLLSQDVLTWVIREIGVERSYELVWRENHERASDFFILDALMRSFTDVGMVSCSLEVLGKMREVGSWPSVSAICVLIKLLLRHGDCISVWKLFRDMICKGPIPTIYIYNMMILGFCRRGSVRIGESLLYLMRKFRCEPDVYTYNIIINTYCVRGSTWDALDWVDLMVESGCCPHASTFATIINAFCKEGNLSEARKIFHWMQEMGVAPNTTIYNALMDGYVKAREIGLASMLYDEMRMKGVAVDSITFNILAGGYYKYRNREDGDNFVRSSSLMDSVDMMIAGLCWAERLDEALAVLKNMVERGIPFSVVSLNSLIVAYGRSGLEDKAFEVYHIMVNSGLHPSASTCTSLVLGLSKNGRTEEAHTLMYQMIEKGYPVSKSAFTVVLNGYFKKGDIVGAHRLWREMETAGMSPDAVAFSAFIDGLSKWGFVQEAHDMFLKMTNQGIVPNNFTYNSLISGFCDKGEMDEAVKLETKMREVGLFPDTITFNIIINGFCRLGEMKSAMDAYFEMYKNGLTPDIVTYNTLIGGYCRQFDMLNAENIANTLQSSGWCPDVTTYNIKIHGYCRSRRMNRAVSIFDELISSGIVPDTVTYNTLLNAVCCDILDRAMILTGRLLKMAFVPDLVTTNLLLSNLRKQGLPHRTAMWARKLREISFEFDEITYKIMDKAYRDIEEDVGSTEEMTGKSLFLDFLMYMTYDFICRNKVYYKTSFDHLEQ